MIPRRLRRSVLAAAVLGLEASCASDPAVSSGPALVGAWRSQIEFQSGAFAAVKGFEFLYAFNSGGTMTESSNYDAAPPVPPAYGVWKQAGARRFEARYEFFLTRVGRTEEEEVASGGWLPAGRGVFDETIELSEDGDTFVSILRYALFDERGKLAEGGGDGKGRGTRLRFPGP